MCVTVRARAVLCWPPAPHWAAAAATAATGRCPVSAAATTASAAEGKPPVLGKPPKPPYPLLGGIVRARGADAGKCCHLHQLRRGLLLAPKQKRHPGTQGPRSRARQLCRYARREHVQDGLRRAGRAGRRATPACCAAAAPRTGEGVIGTFQCAPPLPVLIKPSHSQKPSSHHTPQPTMGSLTTNLKRFGVNCLRCNVHGRGGARGGTERVAALVHAGLGELNCCCAFALPARRQQRLPHALRVPRHRWRGRGADLPAARDLRALAPPPAERRSRSQGGRSCDPAGS